MARVNPAPLQQALSNWNQRAATYNSLGIPQSHWYQIATNDIQNVANTGASPMSTSDVNAAMASQLAGRSIIGNPTPHHQSLLGQITHTITSIPSDVEGLVTGFIPGAVNFAHHLPSEIVNTAELIRHGDDPTWLTAHGYEDPRTGKGLLSEAAADIRNITKSPILSLLPGVADVGNLTTAQGRQWLESHPISAALDVAPAGKITGLATRAVTRGAEAGTALEALRAGQSLRAASRGAMDTIQQHWIDRHLPEGEPTTYDLRKRVSDFFERHGVAQQAQDTARGHTELGRVASRKVKALTQRLHDMGYFKLKDEEKVQIWREAQHLDPVQPHHEAHIAVAKQIVHTLKRYGMDMDKITKGKDGIFIRRHGKGELVFSSTDPIRKSVQRMERIQKVHLPAAHRRINIGIRQARTITDRITSLQKDLADAQERGMPHERLLRDIADQQKRYDQVKVRLTNAVSRRRQLLELAKNARDSYYEQLFKTGGTASMRAQVQSGMRAGLSALRREQFGEEMQSLQPLADPSSQLYHPPTFEARTTHALEQLNRDLGMIEDSSVMDQLRNAITPSYLTGAEATRAAKALFDGIKMDVTRNVLDLISRGMDPLWLHHVDPDMEYLGSKVNVIPDHLMDITQYNRTTFNMAPGVQDIAMGLTSAAREVFRAEGTRQFLTLFVPPRAKTVSELIDQYRARACSHAMKHRRPAAWNVEGHAQALMNREWSVIKPNQYGLADWGGFGRFTKKDELMIPKALDTNLSKMMPGYRSRIASLPMYGAYDKALKVFRFSVLTGPRHLVHVAVAGLVPLILREPTAPWYFKQAWDIMNEVKKGNHNELYGRLSKNLYDFNDGLYATSVGKQYAQWLKQGWEKTGGGGISITQRMAKIEETVSDIYRVSAALANIRRGADTEEAVAMGNKVAVDMDDMAPFERTILKHVFPFYGFTRFLLRYLLTYPTDHPYRVSILARFANQEQEEWSSLLPEKFMMTMFLGHPDEHGNIKSIDLRNLNPFRSFSNEFTIAGFFQQMNPIITAPLTMRGMDVLSASGPLYPQLEFDPVTGSLHAAAPNNALMSGLEQFIPEVGALDHFVGITDQMRILKRTSPAAYRAQLYNVLNLPGVLAPPITVNKPYVEEKQEINRYAAAQQAVSAYTEGKQAPHQ